MSFFDDDEPIPPELALPTPRRRRWRGEPDDSLGVPVSFADYLARNEETAVIVSGIVAFPAGFSFSLISLNRLDPPPEGHELGGPRPWRQRDDAFRLGIAFADGDRVVDDLRHRLAPDAGARVLQRHGGGGGGRRFAQGFFCLPLPPPGPMRFVCRWPARDVEETSLEIDASLILAAAARSTPIWPDDVDLPDEEPASPRGGGWASYVASATSQMSASASPRRRRPKPPAT